MEQRKNDTIHKAGSSYGSAFNVSKHLPPTRVLGIAPPAVASSETLLSSSESFLAGQDATGLADDSGTEDLLVSINSQRPVPKTTTTGLNIPTTKVTKEREPPNTHVPPTLAGKPTTIFVLPASTAIEKPPCGTDSEGPRSSPTLLIENIGTAPAHNVIEPPRCGLGDAVLAARTNPFDSMVHKPNQHKRRFLCCCTSCFGKRNATQLPKAESELSLIEGTRRPNRRAPAFGFHSDTVAVATMSRTHPGCMKRALGRCMRILCSAKWKHRGVELLDSLVVNIFMIFSTIWALFAVDFTEWILPMEVDLYVAIISTLVAVLFLVELLLNCWARENYTGRFLFWLDVLALASMIPEIGAQFFPAEMAWLDSVSLARASRAARIGARVGRLVRVSKLFNSICYRNDKVKKAEHVEPSRVGKKFAETIIFKVIVGMMLILVIFPLLDHAPSYDSREFAMQLLDRAAYANQSDEKWEKSPGFTVVLKEFLDEFGEKLLYLRVRGKVLLHHTVTGLRFKEILSVSKGSANADFNAHEDEATKAGYDILQTITVICILALGSWIFNRDAAKFFVRPVERMTGIVKNLAQNPLMSLAALEQGGKRVDNETLYLEAALKKVAGLLQIGFGEAGAEIISQNLSASGVLDPMVPGRRVEAIFGFCDIRRFTDTTECLQEDVLIFVNRIAKIVHEGVALFGGSPNKNIGDAFLLVWKVKANGDMERYADRALRAFQKIISDIQSSEELRKITETPEIRERMPGFTVKMGFALHLGWAIEGAIGSLMKVDASYLSEHVNITARLESATKQYDVWMLLSSDFVEKLTPAHREGCRKIDCVLMKGCKRPLVLYTNDYNAPISSAGISNPKVGIDAVDIPDLVLPSSTTPVSVSQSIDRVTTANEKYFAYRNLFESAVDKYLEGRWEEARTIFNQCSEISPSDGPTITIMEYMKSKNFKPPSKWKGYRKIDK